MNNKECESKSKFSLKVDDQCITNEAELAPIFINIASKLKEPRIKTDFEKLKNYMSAKVPNDIEFKIPCTNQAFIKHFLSNLNVKKST